MVSQAFRSAPRLSWRRSLRCPPDGCLLILNKEEQKMRTSNIADKIVVITGASSGLGESTAKLLARHRAKVVLGARRKYRIDAVVKEISAAGGKAIGFAADVTKLAEVEALIKEAV